MKSGWAAIARAIAIRWRWPPENSCGNFGASAGWRPTSSSSSSTRAAIARLPRPLALPSCGRNTRIGSAMMSPTRQRGLREANGSWKIICMRRRTARRAARSRVLARSTPSISTCPRLGSSSPTTMRASVDFPEPDSPTSPNVSPRSIAKSRPSTAASVRRGSRLTSREIQGLETSNTRLKPRTSTIASALLQFRISAAADAWS